MLFANIVLIINRKKIVYTKEHKKWVKPHKSYTTTLQYER